MATSLSQLRRQVAKVVRVIAPGHIVAGAFPLALTPHTVKMVA